MIGRKVDRTEEWKDGRTKGRKDEKMKGWQDKGTKGWKDGSAKWRLPHRYGSFRILKVYKYYLQEVMAQLIPVDDRSDVIDENMLSSFVLSKLAHDFHERVFSEKKEGDFVISSYSMLLMI